MLSVLLIINSPKEDFNCLSQEYNAPNSSFKVVKLEFGCRNTKKYELFYALCFKDFHPFWLYTLSVSSSTGFPEFWRHGFDGDILFKLSLHVVSGCVSASVPICWKKSFWWRFDKLVMYEYSSISLRVI